jgi:glucose/arabinose dehydrogenase
MTASLRSAVGRTSYALIATLALGASAPPARAVDITLTPFANGLNVPVAIANAGDSRLFVVEKDGHIKVVLSDGTVLGTDFLDIESLVSMGGEQGLLGLAFHPNYLSNGFFYVNYTDTAGDTQVVRYSVSGDPMTSNVADSMSATPVLSVDQPFANHNGGDIKFGPDGYLYIPLGDGGSFCDPADRAQNPLELLGKILRIDVDSGSPYAIPPSNPFAGSMTTEEEIWALGMRNPFRFSFDRSTGDMYVGDVGQNRVEEIDFQPAASMGGENYGWDCFEGNGSSSLAPSNCTTMATCMPSSNFTFPIHEYDHSGGRCAVIGGFVYRGSQSPSLAGHYFFADECSSDVYSLTTPDNGMTWNLNTFGALVPGMNPTTFGEDSSGEVYITGFNGTVYRITEVVPPVTCPAEPSTSCTSTTKGKLSLKRPGDPAKNRLLWKWQNGPALSQSNFGDPIGGGTGYSLCIYGGTGAAQISASIPGGGGAWTPVSTIGYKFKGDGANDGITKVLLKGAAAGKSKIQVKGKGASLDLGALPLNEPTQILVQLLRNDDPQCWETTFPFASIDADESTKFKAKIP